MSNIKAIFFDIDGTLVSFDTHKIPEPTVEALKKLQEKGIKIFIATGRMLPMITVTNVISFDGYITYNGAYCVNAQKEPIFTNPLLKEDLENLVSYLEKDSFPVAFMSKDEMTVNFINDRVRALIAHIDVTMPRVEDPRISIQQDIYQICIFVDEDKEKELLKNVLTHCQSSRWISYFADINILDNSKQSGIDQVLAHYNINLGETMAFGDGGNDISMLKHVAVGIAMGNANDEVKQSADYVTDTVDNDGIRKALIHFGLLPE